MTSEVDAGTTFRIFLPRSTEPEIAAEAKAAVRGTAEDINGIELTDRLLAVRPELAVLLISSRGGEPEVRRRLATGDVAFLSKPFSPGELTAKVGEAFNRASQRRSPSPESAVPAERAESTTSRQPSGGGAGGGREWPSPCRDLLLERRGTRHRTHAHRAL